LAHFGAGAAGQYEWKHAEDEGEAGHEDGAKPEAAGFDGGMGAVHAGILRLSGKFDDKDGIFSG
jgi:hypothetical protein